MIFILSTGPSAFLECLKLPLKKRVALYLTWRTLHIPLFLGMGIIYSCNFNVRNPADSTNSIEPTHEAIRYDQDSLYDGNTSSVIVKELPSEALFGILQSAGMTTKADREIPHFQLITPHGSYFIGTGRNLHKYWGRCVSIKNFSHQKDFKAPKNYSYINYPLLEVDSVLMLPDRICDQLQAKIVESYAKAADKTIQGHVQRMVRPAPDIHYDYKTTHLDSIPLEFEDERPSEIPIIFNLPLSKVNGLLQKGGAHRLHGYFVGGYGESVVFVVNDFDE